MIEYGIFAFADQTEALTKAQEWSWGRFENDDEGNPVWTRTPQVWCGYCDTVAYSVLATYDSNGDLLTSAVPLDNKVRFMAWRDKSVDLPEDYENYLECRWDEGTTPVLPTGVVMISPVTPGCGL